MRTAYENDILILYPEGKIDSSNAEKVQEEILALLEEKNEPEFIIDAEDLTYISSAGLRIFLKLAKRTEKKIIFRNASLDIYEIMEMTGFDTILDVRKKLREISVDGCEVIGKGAIGTVYRLDPDTIVKVYELPDCMELIEKEQKLSKLAFLHGVPTAISYDIVKVGDKFGTVFELVKAETLGEMIRKNPENADEIIRVYAELIKKIHSVEMEPGILPDAREIFKGYLDQVGDVFTPENTSRLRELLDQMPLDLHLIHGDIQMKNVMYSEGEPMVIDMETMSTGNPVFDLMSLYDAYQIFEEDDPLGNIEFFGISSETSKKIWENTVRNYLNDPDEEKYEETVNKIKVVTYIRFMYQILVMKIGKPELNEIRIRHTAEHMQEILPKIDTLAV